MNHKKTKVKFCYEHNPKKLLMICDAVEASCITALGYSVFAHNEYLSIPAIIILSLSKLISRMFTECSDD